MNPRRWDSPARRVPVCWGRGKSEAFGKQKETSPVAVPGGEGSSHGRVCPLQASDKRKALEETMALSTQSLASVTYQVSSLATAFLRLLDLQAAQLRQVEADIACVAQVGPSSVWWALGKGLWAAPRGWRPSPCSGNAEPSPGVGRGFPSAAGIGLWGVFPPHTQIPAEGTTHAGGSEHWPGCHTVPLPGLVLPELGDTDAGSRGHPASSWSLFSHRRGRDPGVTLEAAGKQLRGLRSL